MPILPFLKYNVIWKQTRIANIKCFLVNELEEFAGWIATEKHQVFDCVENNVGMAMEKHRVLDFEENNGDGDAWVIFGKAQLSDALIGRVCLHFWRLQAVPVWITPLPFEV